MKKIIRGFAVFLAAVMVWTGVCACRPAAAETEERMILTPEDADEWVRVLLGEHPEALNSGWKMSAQMRMAVIASGGMQGLARQLASLGTAEEIGRAYAGEIKGFQVFYIPCVFSAQTADLVLATDQGAVAGLTVGPYTGSKAEETRSEAFDSYDLAVPVPALKGELPGTLLVPRGEGPFPAVVLVHGSGPNDRDETIFQLKPFRDLAEGLAEMGVAVYRYDKRTYVYGEEMADFRQGTLMDETIQDAAAAVQLLAQQEKIDPARIFVLGHSLGGNAVPAIDRELRKQPSSACGYIMMAASPRPLDVLMREQYDFLYSLLPQITPEQQAQKDAMFSELDKLRDLDALTDEDQVAGAYAPYWKWLAAYDALAAAEEMTKPCLLLQGEEDYQTTMEDFAIWRDALGNKENWRLISYPGLTHPFTPGLKTEGSAAYARSGHVDARVIRDIADFIAQAGNNP